MRDRIDIPIHLGQRKRIVIVGEIWKWIGGEQGQYAVYEILEVKEDFVLGELLDSNNFPNRSKRDKRDKDSLTVLMPMAEWEKIGEANA